MKVFSDILDMIGNTPIVELKNLDTGKCQLFAKLEYLNPGGSIKDRIAKEMILTAEASGKLKPGDTLIEATAGNTGLGLALLAIQRGYKLLVVMPDKMSKEKVFNLKAMGAKVVMTRSDVMKGHQEYYQDKAKQISSEMENAFYVDQFENEANVAAHYQHTGPEIWEQMQGKLDAVVCGVGTGGTITGIGRFMKEKNSAIEMVLADPKGSVLAHYIDSGKLGKAGSWYVEGIGEDFIPSICDMTLIDKAITIPDQQAFDVARELLSKEGLMVGSSSGTLLGAALLYCQNQKTAKKVITLFPDSGTKYMSKMYNDDWMYDKGFISRRETGDLRDLIIHQHDQKEVVYAAPNDTLLTAYQLIKENAYSQLPVLNQEKLVGIIDESDILLRVYNHPDRFEEPVKKAMTTNLEVIDYKSSIDLLMDIFNHDHIAIVMDGNKFLGIISRIDLINYIRKVVS